MATLKGDAAAILAVFVGAIIAITFMTPIGDQVFTQTTSSFERQNQTVTFTGSITANNTAVDLPGRELITQIELFNVSDKDNVTTYAMWLTTGTSASTGLRSVQLLANTTADLYSGSEINATYTYVPDGYLNNVGARGMSTLILIMGALAITIFVIVVFVKKGFLGQVIRGRI